MSWFLHTDVLCQPAKRNGNPRVMAWLEREKEHCYTSAIVIAQLAYWVRSKEGRQRQALQAWLTKWQREALGQRRSHWGVMESAATQFFQVPQQILPKDCF